MSFIVEQKVKGKIYLYEVVSYWDKSKKQPRQHRTYLGPKETQNKENNESKPINLITKSWGNIFWVKFIAQHLGLEKLLKEFFPEDFREILALAYYEIMEGSVLYLFQYWHDEHDLPAVKKMYSSSISCLVDEIGRNQASRHNFLQQWMNTLKPIRSVYYDITSISSYSTNIDFIEWGYNRDKEKLPQLNMGLVFSETHALPIHYQIYPGSIVDVTTLKNCITYLKYFGIENVLMILDRGFFSKTNILELNAENNKIFFIQPLPFKLKNVKLLLKKQQKKSKQPKAFKYN